MEDYPATFARHSNTVIYARLSKDRRKLSENVNIQIAECQGFAADESWPVVGIFKDNDISASKYSTKPRDDYNRMVAIIKRGGVHNILITEMPRLYRRLEELLDLIRLAESTDLRRIQTTEGISYNLSTSEGIHAAIDAVNNAMREVARISTRIKRKVKARAKDGQWHGGGRPYGYEEGGIIVRESEAEVIRECAKRFVAGESIRDIVRDLNGRGVPTATGKEWRIENLQRTIMKKRYIGVREYEGQDYPAAWPAILKTEQWEQMEARRLSRASRWPKSPHKGRKYLLTGFIYCGNCGTAMVGSGRSPEGDRPGYLRYRCRYMDNHGRVIGCGKVFRNAAPLELLVSEAVWHVFDNPKTAITLAPKVDEDRVRAAVEEYERRKAKLDQLVTDYATDVLTKDQFVLAKGVAESKVFDARSALAALQDDNALARVPADQTISEAWETAGLDWRRSVTRLVVERVTVQPAGAGGFHDWRGYRFNPDLIQIKWKV
ncbi:recombinase family protein [Streptomyces sp. NPDC090075]|uniref:recombinase family protein n=1 Tax=Streptomyces sp. NPDC090075 TaxID=3365937 RepID=UPI003808DFC5